MAMDLQSWQLIIIGGQVAIIVGMIFLWRLLKKWGEKTEIGWLESFIKEEMKGLQERVPNQIEVGATQQFERFGMIQTALNQTLSDNREEINKQLATNREEVSNQFERFGRIQTALSGTLSDNREEINKQLTMNRTEVNKELARSREEINNQLYTNREETNRQLAMNIATVNTTLEKKMTTLQASNEQRLDKMQGIVDEKLQKTLENRISQSFETVRKELNSVQQGLGEMKNLAEDTKGLKNVLTNVKQRGIYGEVILGKLLADMLAPGQYEENTEIAYGKRVEFTIKFPNGDDKPLLLPIDSKFPTEDYQRLIASEDKEAIESARRALGASIEVFAKDIHDKYIVPPKTTDFAMMFLPTEGLYAEISQNAVLFEKIRSKYKVIIVGPTTLSAALSSFQMGFRTLAIGQKSQKVWETLSDIKKEFETFEGVFDKVQKQLNTASGTLSTLKSTRMNAMNKKLRDVEILEVPEKAEEFIEEPTLKSEKTNQLEDKYKKLFI